MKLANVIRLIVISSALSMPFIAAGASLAQNVSYLVCNSPVIALPDKPDLLPSETLAPLCDLSIKKEVSINGAAFVDANTTAAAPSAYIGDQVTWKVTVTNTSTRGATPTSNVTVGDVLPAGFKVVSSTTSNTPRDFTANIWNINTGSDTLPAVLTIVTTATTAGTFKNTAAFTIFDSCNEGCNSTYNDADPSNNSDDAYVTVLAKPQVLGASTTIPTLANTGTNTLVSALAATLLAATTGVLVYVRRSNGSRNK